MAVIKCPHCGKYISSNLSLCTECGSPLSDDRKTPVTVQKAVEKGPVRRVFHLSARRIVVLCFLAPFVIAAVYLIIDDIKKANALEQRSYERLANTTDLLVYEDFLVRFPESKYASEVKKRYEDMKVEQGMFFREAANGGRADLEAFIQAHPSSPFRAVCELRIDSLDWRLATDDNTLESYQRYLTQHPQGVFLSDATDARNRMQRLVVTPEETSILRSIVDNFFSAMTQRDAVRIDELVHDPFTFCGMSESTGAYVVDYYQQQMHYDDVMGLHFQLGGTSINKRSVPGSDALSYNLYSTAQATFNRSSLDSTTVVNYKVSASFTPDHRITSLSISQIQDVSE